MNINLYSLFHSIKNWFTRIVRGYGCCDLWGLDYHLAVGILPKLRAFKDKTNSYPGDLKSIEEWYAELDKMIWSMEHIINENNGKCCWNFEGVEVINDHRKREQEGLDLFGKRFRSLWI